MPRVLNAKGQTSMPCLKIDIHCGACVRADEPGVKYCRQGFAHPKSKNPGQLDCPGLAAGYKAHAVRGFATGEMNRPQCDWRQVITSRFAGVGYPVESD